MQTREQPARYLHTRESLGDDEIGHPDTATIWRDCDTVKSDTHQKLTDSVLGCLWDMSIGVKFTEGQ